MRNFAVVLLRWTGRFLILLGVYVVVAALFLPEGVQALNPVVCPPGTELSNHRYSLPGAPSVGKLELVCTSATDTVTVGGKVLLTAVALATLGLVSLFFSQRMALVRHRVPTGPTLR